MKDIIISFNANPLNWLIGFYDTGIRLPDGPVIVEALHLGPLIICIMEP